MRTRLRDFKNDDAVAAKVLDLALARHAQEPTPDLGRALTARIELAVALDDAAGAARFKAQLQALGLEEG